MNEPLTAEDRPTSRRITTIGVVSGLIAGGAIGLVAAVPSLTSAASDDSAATSDDAALVLQDDTDEPTDDTQNRPQPGERLRELLQPLVDDDTIDAAQADAVTEHLVENRPEHDRSDHRQRRRGLDEHGRDQSVVADLLGIEHEELRAELQAGKSIADIATEQDIDVQTVVDALIADAESHLDLAVEHGLDDEQAAERLERITERIEEGVNRSRDTDG